MAIDYKQGRKLELWVRDTGVFEGFALFLNGEQVDEVGDQSTQKYAIERPEANAAIVIHFGGADGGDSAVVDVTDPKSKKRLEKQSGLQHSYLIHRA